MGISASKRRVKNSLSNMAEFDSACESGFAQCLAMTDHHFEYAFPYQLVSAAEQIFVALTLLRPRPVVLLWLTSPPTRSQVHSALQLVTRPDDNQTLPRHRFKEWALELFAALVLSAARNEALREVPITIAGIAGVGTVARQGKGLIGAAIGVYALVVSSAVYWSLGSTQLVAP